MNPVNTFDLLKAYIFSKLGSPVINIELTDNQIEIIIYQVIQKFSEFAMEGGEKTALKLDLIPDVQQYTLDSKITAVQELRTTSNGYTYQYPGGLVVTPTEFFAWGTSPGGSFDITNMVAVLSRLDTIQSYFNLIPNYSFNPYSKVLTFHERVVWTSAVLYIDSQYTPKPVDGIFDQQWVKDMSVALCKMQWGENLAKYDAPLINGARVNYQRIIDEANTAIEKLDEQLLTRWTKPLGLMRF